MHYRAFGPPPQESPATTVFLKQLVVRFRLDGVYGLIATSRVFDAAVSGEV